MSSLHQRTWGISSPVWPSQSWNSLPVFSKGRLRGAIGYDDCTNERVWEKEEIEALRIASSIVGVLCYD